MTFVERKSEPIVIFCEDKCAPREWDCPMYRMFAGPFNTIGLIIDPSMHDGFKFEVHYIHQDRDMFLSCLEQMYDLLVLICGDATRLEMKMSLYGNDIDQATNPAEAGLAHADERPAMTLHPWPAQVGRSDPRHDMLRGRRTAAELVASLGCDTEPAIMLWQGMKGLRSNPNVIRALRPWRGPS
jgi:hypothetical protein